MYNQNKIGIKKKEKKRNKLKTMSKDNHSGKIKKLNQKRKKN